MTALLRTTALTASVAAMSLVAGGAYSQTRLSGSGFASAGWQGPSPAAVRAGGVANERAKRADRVAELIDTGHCADARRAALSDGDQAMAHKAEALCYLRSHPPASSR